MWLFGTSSESSNDENDNAPNAEGDKPDGWILDHRRLGLQTSKRAAVVQQFTTNCYSVEGGPCFLQNYSVDQDIIQVDLRLQDCLT